MGVNNASEEEEWGALSLVDTTAPIKSKRDVNRGSYDAEKVASTEMSVEALID